MREVISTGGALRHSLVLAVVSLLVPATLLAPVCATCVFSFGKGLDEPLVVRVGVYDNPPKVFIDDNGDAQGFFPDVIEYIAAQEGWALEYVEGNWTECLDRLGTGEVEIMVDVAISEVRGEEYLFSNESMLLSWGIVYSRRDVKVESIPELDGKSMAVMTESIHTTGEGGILDIIDEFQLNVTVVECEDYAQVFESLDNHTVDVGVVNRVFGSVYEDEYDVSRTPIMFNPTDLRFAATRNSTISPYLIERIDFHLGLLKRDPTSIYYTSLRTYIPNLFEDESKIPSWLVPVLLSAFGVLVIVVLLNLLLRYEVKAKTAELRKAYDALVKEKNRSDLYVDLLSHDIANIDQGIYTSAELADRESVDNPELHMYIDSILRHVRRAVDMIAAVRLLSTLRKEPVRPGNLSLNAILKDSIDEVRGTFPDGSVKIEFTPPPKDVMIRAEPLVGNVFRNILNNAVRHQRRKEKRVMVEVAQAPENGSVTISISDHGPGIPDAMKSSLLQRSESTSDMRLTGIGLALVKELVDRYDGTVEIKDRVEGDHAQGARFVITFPTYEAAVRSSDAS